LRQGLGVANRGIGGGGSGEGSSAGRLAREVSAMQATLLRRLREEAPGADLDAFADASQRLAGAFGEVTAAAIDPLSGPAPAGAPGPTGAPRPTEAETLPSLYQPGHMRRRLDQLIETHRRYGHPFCLAVFDVAGPATRNGDGGSGEAALTVVGAALRDSVRLVDEPFRLEEDALCVLAPDQNTVGGVQMSERLLQALADLEAAGGLPIEISAGVAACPEHGAEAEGLLRKADEAMWRARALGQPVGVGLLQDR
jgi:diguanylate cyclase (GGDEF)-like protein